MQARYRRGGRGYVWVSVSSSDRVVMQVLPFLLDRFHSNVSVSSSDRVVMQEIDSGAATTRSPSFSILIGSGGDASWIVLREAGKFGSFSILIGSGGDASNGRGTACRNLCQFQYPHRIGW